MDVLSVLQLSLHEQLIGFLVGFKGGKNVLVFVDEFTQNPTRLTFSLTTHPDFPNAEKLLAIDWVTQQRLHPVLSNLLPEGALRELLAQSLKIHPDHEFPLFSWLGQDLAGALVATPLPPEAVPQTLLNRLKPYQHGQTRIIQAVSDSKNHKFSLAGVQLKFSMKAQDGRYNLVQTASHSADALGDWIIKMPSTRHAELPCNEFTAMSLAALVGVQIPEIKLVALDQLDNLPPINLPAETLAFAIKRFDRIATATQVQRVHMEDFAQILVKYPHEKYSTANYRQLGQIIYRFSGDGIADMQQFARRLLVNILLANGDAHLKNWSLLYSNGITPRLAPAYDIVTTAAYITGESTFALKLAKHKEWYQATLADFRYWAEKSGMSWSEIEPHLADVMDKARTLWPAALAELPMAAEHQRILKAHWRNLQADFQIQT